MEENLVNSEDASDGDQKLPLTDRAHAWQLIFQELMAAPDREAYIQQLQQAAKTMDCSVRSVQRHFHRWREEGSNSLHTNQLKRRDQISEELKQWIIQLYCRGNKQGNTMNPRQVFQTLRFEFFKAGNLLGQEECPSLSTVYRILKPVIEAQRQNQFHPSEVQRLQVTSASFSNEVWWCNLIRLPQQVRNCFGEPAGYPILISLHDGYSQNVLAAKLTLSSSLEEAIALTLRQAILPKEVKQENASLHQWTASGFPTHLVIDCEKNLSRLSSLGNILEVKVHRGHLAWRIGGAIESFNWQMIHALKLVPKHEDQQTVCLSLKELEELVILYIVDHYNQQRSSKEPNQTRSQKWEAGLIKFPPDVPSERSLDFCLPKSSSRIIQRGGRIQFEGQTYRNDCLSSHAGEAVFLRYNPSNITTILVYKQQESEENFLARACIQHFHEESLSLDDAKAIQHRQRQEHNPD